MCNIAAVNLQPSMDILALLAKVLFMSGKLENHDILHQTDILTTIEGSTKSQYTFSKKRFLPTLFDDGTRVNECCFFSSSLSPLLIRFRIRFWPSSKWSTCYGRGSSAVG